MSESNNSLCEAEVTKAVMSAARLFGFKFNRRNVGMAFGASGKPVRFGEPGQLDWYGRGPAGTRCQDRELELEIKRENFNPTRIYGKEKARFAKQLANMVEINRRGGFALWVSCVPTAVIFLRCLIQYEQVRVNIQENGYYEVYTGSD